MESSDTEETHKAIEKIAEIVSRKVSPSPAEAAAEKKFAATLSRKLAAKLGREAEINFVGSAARDTGLAGDRDIDLFVAFPVSRDREYIIRKTISATKSAVKAKWEMHYAEHPYLRANVSGYEVEVIPCFKIKPQQKIKSAVDRSPLHMKYLQEKLSPRQRRDVRVLKKLLKANGIYGAEIEVEGFSGLVCEQMILNYRSLAGLVEAAKDWKPPVIIDLEGAYQGEAGRQALTKKFSDSPLILVDAIDYNRNAAAAVNATNLSKFITLCRAFWRRPSLEFFFHEPKKPDATRIAKAITARGHSLFLVQTSKPTGIVADVLTPQLRKSAAAIARQLERVDFNIYDFTSFSSSKNCFMLFELETSCLAPLKRVRGPPVTDEKACENFLASHKPSEWARGPYVEGGSLAAEKKRETTNARDALKKIVSQPKANGIASHFLKPVSKARIFEGDEITRSKAFEEEALPFLEKFVFRRDWWLSRQPA